MKKVILSILIIASYYPAASAGFFKKKFPKPTASIEKFDIESISLRDITFLFDVGIYNPYPVNLKLKDIKLTFFVENKQLFRTNTARGFTIKKKRKAFTRFRVNLIYSDIIKIIKAYSKKDYLNCVTDVVIVIPLPKFPGLPKSVSFRYKLRKKIPAIKPTVRIANFKVKKPSLKEVDMALKKSAKKLKDPKKVFGMFNDILSGRKPKKVINPSDIDLKLKVKFDIVLKNDTKAKLRFNKLNYDFFVNRSRLISGRTTNIKTIGNKSILRVSNEFSSKALSKSILNAFKNMKGNFSLKGYTMIKFPDSVKKEPLKLRFDEKGNLSIGK